MIAKDLKEILKDIPDDSVIAVATIDLAADKEGRIDVVGSRVQYTGKKKELVLYTHSP